MMEVLQRIPRLWEEKSKEEKPIYEDQEPMMLLEEIK